MKNLFLFILFVFINISLQAQNLIDTGALIQGGVEDGSKLVEAYVKPLNKAIVFGLSDVTYAQIKGDRKGKLLLSLKLAYINIPTDELQYDVTKLKLQHFEAKDPNNVMAQTVFGDSLKVVTLVSKEKDLLGRPLIEFDTPGGSQKSAMPLPFLGATYRLKYTNLSVDFIPYIPIPNSDFKIGMFGAGVQQDLAMFISGLKDKSYGIDVQANASYLYGHSDLDIRPGGIYSPISITGSTTGPYDNQEINIAYTAINFALYGHYDLSEALSIYGGSGLNFGSSHIEVNGTYPVYTADPTGTGSVVADDVYDPLQLDNSFDRIKLEVGVRGEWKRFYLQAGYVMADYGGLAFNLGYKML